MIQNPHVNNVIHVEIHFSPEYTELHFVPHSFQEQLGAPHGQRVPNARPNFAWKVLIYINFIFVLWFITWMHFEFQQSILHAQAHETRPLLSQEHDDSGIFENPYFHFDVEFRAVDLERVRGQVGSCASEANIGNVLVCK